MLKKILITGARGMLGRELIEVFRNDKKYEVFGVVRSEKPKKPRVNYIKADLRDTKNLKKVITGIKPNVIIHCAAIVNLDECEKNKKDANLVHVEATKILSSYGKNKTKFIYMSTDSVFNGKTGNYTEFDRPDPLNFYALSKLNGERAAKAGNKNSLVIRMNIYGFHVPPGNSLAEWALNNFALKKHISGFTDVFFNPVYTKQLAGVTKYILEKKDIKGILNIGSEESVSKYDFLRSLANNFKVRRALIRPVSIDYSDLKITRSKNTTLNIGKLKKLLGNKTPEISKGLAEFKKDYLKEFATLKL